MINTIKKLLGLGPAVNYKELMANGAQIIDVRTKGEYQGGHIRGSVNIPLNTLQQSLSKIKKDKHVFFEKFQKDSYIFKLYQS